MQPVLRSRTARAAAFPALLLVLVACGGADPDPSADGTPASAVTSSPPETRTGAPSDDGNGTDREPADDAEDDAAAGQGSWDEETLVPAMMAAVTEQRTAHVTMTTDAGGTVMEAEGDVAFRGQRQDMALVIGGAGLGARGIEVRMVDEVVYLSMPPMTPPGKFLEIEPGSDSPLAGMAEQMQTVDPRQTFKAFQSGLEEVAFLGRESVDGEHLERYRLTVDVSETMQAQGEPRTSGMPDTVRYELWLDEDALMRRVEFSMMRQMSMEMEMSRWGEPVTITAPSDSDIVQAPGR